MQPRDFAILVWWVEEDGGYYLGKCLEIPPCTGQGATPMEAVEGAYRAVQAHLDYREELGLPPPQPTSDDVRSGRRTLHRAGTSELVKRLKGDDSKEEV